MKRTREARARALAERVERLRVQLIAASEQADAMAREAQGEASGHLGEASLALATCANWAQSAVNELGRVRDARGMG